MPYALEKIITHNGIPLDAEQILAALNNRPATQAAPSFDSSKSAAQIECDDIVVDKTTGLMWSRVTNAERKTWSEAKRAAAALTLGGFRDWRLPTRRELLTLVDDTRSNPTIDMAKFECESCWYWSSTPLASSPSGYAWSVFFGSGLADCLLQDSGGRVRAVRSVSPAASGQ